MLLLSQQKWLVNEYIGIKTKLHLFIPLLVFYKINENVSIILSYNSVDRHHIGMPSNSERIAAVHHGLGK